jgi:predicted transcriptional regulator of viral defense system
MRSSNDVELPKTLGPRSARLVVELHERGRTLFAVRDVERVTGLGAKSARNLAGRLVERGLATRLKSGLFLLVPFELGREREFLGNPYVVARELSAGREAYLSHASAMDLHGMATQPRLVVVVTSPHPFRSRTILGTEFRFVRCRPEDMFGLVEHWVEKTEKVRVSDLERTVIDGLRRPELCGGFSEVAKGFDMRRGDIDPRRLVDSALRLGVGVVVRRLGFLMEVSGVDEHGEIDRLRSHLTATYHLLDPTLPAEGRYFARWRLRLNVTPEEIEAARSA